MKKILTLLLTLSLLFLYSCAAVPPSDGESQGKVYEYGLREKSFNINDIYRLSDFEEANATEIKTKISEMLKNDCRELGLSSISGNISIDKAFIAEYVIDINNYVLDISSKPLIIEDSELYSDGSEEYVYLIFTLMTGEPDLRYEECTYANIESGNISVKLSNKRLVSVNGDPVTIPAMEIYRTVILKVQKSSLGEGYTPNEDSNTPANNELTDSDREALRALLESDNLQELNKSEATGNIPVENAFMIREALPDGLSCDLEYDRERDIFISQS